MIYPNTIIHIADNSGPKKAKSLNIKKKKNRLFSWYFSCSYKKKYIEYKKKVKKKYIE